MVIEKHDGYAKSVASTEKVLGKIIFMTRLRLSISIACSTSMTWDEMSVNCKLDCDSLQHTNRQATMGFLEFLDIRSSASEKQIVSSRPEEKEPSIL